MAVGQDMREAGGKRPGSFSDCGVSKFSEAQDARWENDTSGGEGNWLGSNQYRVWKKEWL